MTLASIGSKRAPTVAPSSIPASTRMPSPLGQRSRSTRPVAGRKSSSASSAYRRTSIAWPPSARALVDLRLRQIERPALGDAQLLLDEVDAGHELGHRMLDLEARVHLEEEDLAAIGQEELARPGAPVADGAGEAEGVLGQLGADLRLHGGRRRLLEDLLVTPLGRAVALAEVDAGPVGVEQDLDLDVTRPFDEALEDQPVVVERRDGFPARARRGHRSSVFGSRTVRMPLPPPPAAGLTSSG